MIGSLSLMQYTRFSAAERYKNLGAGLDKHRYVEGDEIRVLCSKGEEDTKVLGGEGNAH